MKAEVYPEVEISGNRSRRGGGNGKGSTKTLSFKQIWFYKNNLKLKLNSFVEFDCLKAKL